MKAFQCHNITYEQVPTEGDRSGEMRRANECTMKAIMLNDGSVSYFFINIAISLQIGFCKLHTFVLCL